MSPGSSNVARYAPTPAPELAADAHKGDAGRLLCVCGSRDMPGAAVLVVRAAHRAGAGLVTLACSSEVLRVAVAAASPETITIELSEASNDALPLRGRTDHARAAGPGLGTRAPVRKWVDALLDDDFDGPLVLDADALNVLGRELERVARRSGPTVLTPHPGEASRLLGREVGKDDASRLDAAREISLRARAICCLKGHRTVVTDGERTHVNRTGNAAMAKGGSGDVLTGVVGAYLAACRAHPSPRWSIFDAVASAVHVHGLSGDLCARVKGQRGAIPSDFIEALPAAQLQFAAERGEK